MGIISHSLSDDHLEVKEDKTLSEERDRQRNLAIKVKDQGWEHLTAKLDGTLTTLGYRLRRLEISAGVRVGGKEALAEELPYTMKGGHHEVEER